MVKKRLDRRLSVSLVLYSGLQVRPMDHSFIHIPDSYDSAPPPIEARVDAQPFAPDDQLRLHIDQLWERRTAQSARVGRDWYNGQIWRPLGFADGKLQVSQDWFKNFIGTAKLPAKTAHAERVGHVSVAVLPALVEEYGGRALGGVLFRRAANALAFGGWLSGLGGFMEPPNDGTDPLAAALREIREETGLEIQRSQLHYIGLGHSAASGAFNYCFVLELTAKDLDRGISFNDGEMTGYRRVPLWLLHVLASGWVPLVAPWVRAFAKRTLEHFADRLK